MAHHTPEQLRLRLSAPPPHCLERVTETGPRRLELRRARLEAALTVDK
jgi:hypothetical protein